VVDLDGDDVLVLGHRPEWPDRAFFAVMHRRLAPEPPEIGLPDVLLVELRIADVDLVERRCFGERRKVDGGRSIHHR
jgi:hypothetical protein